MVTIFDVAKYILEQLGEMSPMKLQKLCYYAQAWSLAWDNKPLFHEEFRAWRSGPVCCELYDISKRKDLIKTQDIPGDSDKLSNNQKNSINIVLADYGNRDGLWLSLLSKSEEPCRRAFRFCEAPNEIIAKDSMAVYYRNLISEN